VSIHNGHRMGTDSWSDSLSKSNILGKKRENINLCEIPRHQKLSEAFDLT
jgi:hypothetical protein